MTAEPEVEEEAIPPTPEKEEAKKAPTKKAPAKFSIPHFKGSRVMGEKVIMTVFDCITTVYLYITTADVTMFFLPQRKEPEPSDGSEGDSDDNDTSSLLPEKGRKQKKPEKKQPKKSKPPPKKKTHIETEGL